MRIARVAGSALLTLVAAVVVVGAAHASPQGQLTQSVTPGTLTTDIRDGSYTTVASPTFGMSTLNISNDCQTSTGTYGSASQRIYVDNPGGANNGWTLSIAATAGASAKWVSGGNDYDFDDPAGSGCTNGQLTLDPSVGTVTADAGTTTAITKGSSSAFNSNSSTTLLTAAAGSDDIFRGYLTGVGVSQKVPASKPAGSYAISLTQTILAN